MKRPSYEMVFTCKPCGERSMHTVSKQGYHHGTVLVACPGCKARHLIADHLKVFASSHAFGSVGVTDGNRFLVIRRGAWSSF